MHSQPRVHFSFFFIKIAFYSSYRASIFQCKTRIYANFILLFSPYLHIVYAKSVKLALILQTFCFQSLTYHSISFITTTPIYTEQAKEQEEAETAFYFIIYLNKIAFHILTNRFRCAIIIVIYCLIL